MVKNLFIIVFASIALAGCGGQSEKLQSQLDSLRMELQTSKQFTQTLQEVSVLMDSIDANRQLLRVNMVEGTTYSDYTSRMKDINNYVKDTQHKIEDLEKELKKSKGSANAYAAGIKKLKTDLQAKNDEIGKLQDLVATMTNENMNLSSKVTLQETELTDKSSQIEAKKQELALLEQKIQQVQLQSRISEADSYWARAQAVEEAGNRTKLAPKKKKETYKEAIELYRKSLSLGKTDAQAKIDQLEKKVK